MEDSDLAFLHVLNFVRSLDPPDAEREQSLLRAAGRQILEGIVRTRELRRRQMRSRPYRREPIWFGNENGQNVRKPDAPIDQLAMIPQDLEQVLEIEVQVAMNPPAFIVPSAAGEDRVAAEPAEAKADASDSDDSAESTAEDTDEATAEPSAELIEAVPGPSNDSVEPEANTNVEMSADDDDRDVAKCGIKG